MEHPIESLMQTVMTSLRDMIDVNTIVGNTVETHDKTIIIPVSKVSVGFAAGGSEFNLKQDGKRCNEDDAFKLPFGGGSGAGVNLTPVAFLVVKDGNTKLLTVNPCNPWDKLMDLAPDVANKVIDFIQKTLNIETKRTSDNTKNNCFEETENNFNDEDYQ